MWRLSREPSVAAPQEGERFSGSDPDFTEINGATAGQVHTHTHFTDADVCF
jgi:hypothetical protein